MNKCPECGLIHPPERKGNCPILRARKLQNSDKGREIVQFTSELSKYLDSIDNWKEVIDKMKEQLNM